MSEEAMRKAFEAWAMSQGHIASELKIAWDGYEKPSVHWQWQAWQAATRAAVPDGWKVVPVEPTVKMIAAAPEVQP